MLSILLLAILGVATASSSHCVASSSDSYVCTENTGRAEEFDVGVAQRISGSPGETYCSTSTIFNHLFGWRSLTNNNII
jgi:hypothetical protein